MSCTDRNLLLGILALQNGFVDGKQLIAAMNAWLLEKETSLGEILARQLALKPEEMALLETLVARHLAAHGNYPEKSPAALSSQNSFRDELHCVADANVQASLTHVASDRAIDPLATLAHSVGASSSAGSRFRILRPHAKGGLGEVYVAEDVELRREVALKQIQHEFADQANSRSRFVLEAEITGGLEHPGIVPVYGLGTYANGRPFYAMRFIRGDSLNDAIERFHGGLPATDGGFHSLEFRKLLQRLIDVCNAVAYAHARGVLHRDLKPGNIMLGKYGETLVVDWGLAKAIGRQGPREQPAIADEISLRPGSGNGSAPTQLGAAIGTPQYMSPEQAAGRHDEVGAATDVYSLGATLFCLLTGQPPLADKAGADVGQQLRRVKAGDIPPPRQIKPEIPKPLEAICRKAMAVKPAARYSSPRGLADDLEHWLADEPTAALPDSLYERLCRQVRRHRSVAITTIAAAILIAVVASAATVVINQQRRVATDLAQQNAKLAIAAQQAREKAEKLAAAESSEREKAERLAEQKSQLAMSEQHAREEAMKSAAAEKLQREKAEQLAMEKEMLALAEQQARTRAEKSTRDEKLAREKADKLAEFLIGAIQPDDPTRFTGATFFAPKADFRKFTVFEMLGIELRRSREELSGSRLTLAAVLDSIGDVCRQLAAFEDAERLLNESLRIRRELLDSDDPDLATSCFHTAWYYQERGDFDRARPLYHEALEIRRSHKLQGLVAETLQNLAWIHYYDESAKEMDECFDEALRIREELLTMDQGQQRKALLRSVAYTKLGMAYASAGLSRMLDAKRIANEPLLRKQIIELHGNENLANALAHFVRAGDDRLFREPLNAAAELKAALELIRKSASKEEVILTVPVTIELIHALGKLDRAAEAEQYYRAAIDVARRNQMFQIPKQASILDVLGGLLRKLGKDAEAQKLWQEYLLAQKFRFGEQHRFYQAADKAYERFRAGGASRSK